MVNYGINIVGILGILLLLLGLLLVPLGLWLRKPFRRGNLFQDVVLALVFLLCGSIFLFQGWRFDPILQFAQLLLIATTVYLLIKDIFSQIQIVIQPRNGRN